MRRIIHNTTAIAACLSLLAPHMAMAQTAAPEDIAEEQQPADATLATELQPCDEGGEVPCPAPEEAAEAVVPDAGVADPAPQDEAADDIPDADQGSDAAQAPVDDTEALPEAAEADMQAADEAVAPEAEAQVETDAAAEAEAAASPEATEAATGEADVQADAVADTPSADEATLADPDPLAQALEQQAREDEVAAEPEAAPAEAPAQQGAESTDNVEAADDEALARALEAEAEAQAEAGTGTADAQTSGEAPTDARQPGESAEAEAVPEQGVQETEAAREAAQGGEAATAAALDDEATDAEATEEQVTEENRRSSDEDFATSLRDALGAAAGGQQAAPAADEGERSDRNDLARALLLGLGGIAVGAMLTNNRQVALSAPDRVVITRPDGSQQVIKDEVALLRQPGATVTTENFADGSSRTIVTRADGSRVVTIRDADLRVLRRTLIAADGTSTRLIDDTTAAEPVDIASLPAPARVPQGASGQMNEDELRAALLRESNADRRFTLAQIRNIPEVRALVAPVNIDAITFDTGSAAIKPDQARQLSSLGNVIRDMIAQNPREIVMIEGHTDTVGSDAANLALSDRRAESVALALTEYFDVPPENMVVQGYGEQFLKVRAEGDVRENRRASVRRITDLLHTAAN